MNEIRIGSRAAITSGPFDGYIGYVVRIFNNKWSSDVVQIELDNGDAYNVAIENVELLK